MNSYWISWISCLRAWVSANFIKLPFSIYRIFLLFDNSKLFFSSDVLIKYFNRTFIDFQLCRIRYVCEGNVISSSIWNFVCSKLRYGGRNLTKKSAKMGPSERPKFARRSAWFLVTSPVVHCAPGAGCAVLFSDTIDRAENFHFKKNGGKYTRTEFWSGCIRRRRRKGRNYSLDSDNDDGDLGDFDPEAGENQVPRCRWHVSV